MNFTEEFRQTGDRQHRNNPLVLNTKEKSEIDILKEQETKLKMSIFQFRCIKIKDVFGQVETV